MAPEAEALSAPDIEADLASAFARHQGGDIAPAVSAYRRAIALVPGSGEAWHLLALAAALGHAGTASHLVLLRAAILPSGRADLLGGVAAALLNAGFAKKARRMLKRSIALAPATASSWSAMGVISRVERKFVASVTELERAITTDPVSPETVDNLISAYFRCGEPIAARRTLDGLLARSPSPTLLARRICTSFLLSSEPPATSLRLAREFDRRFAGGRLRMQLAPGGDLSEKKLRIGYVAGDGFRMHTAAMTLLPTILGHDPDTVEVYCYSDVATADEDAVTAEFRAGATEFRETRTLDDDGLARLINDDRINIAVDSLGFPTGSRLLALGRRPAPVQVNWMVMGSLGMRSIDYVLGDRYLMPPGAEDWFEERILRLGCGFAYDPLVEPPEPSPTGGRPLTFGSLNQLVKLSPVTIDLWAAVLASVPRSRLLLKGEGSDDPLVAGRI